MSDSRLQLEVCSGLLNIGRHRLLITLNTLYAEQSIVVLHVRIASSPVILDDGLLFVHVHYEFSVARIHRFLVRADLDETGETQAYTTVGVSCALSAGVDWR